MEHRLAVHVRYSEPKAGATIEDQVGSAHARQGMPVELRVTRGNQTQVMYLTVREALHLTDALRAATEHAQSTITEWTEA